MGLILPLSNNPLMETNNDFDQLMNEAKELIARKDKIEGELRELEDVISTSGVGMSESLIDANGFPRSEIDIHSIRTSRNMIIRLRNDHRAVMTDIEIVLHKIHEAKRQQSETTAPESAPQSTIQSPVLRPFAVVNAVAPDSPAYEAGLRRADRIAKFGHVNADNHNNLQALNVLISRSENQQLPITIIRNGLVEELIVTPKSGWGGRGTLGCHILPANN